MEELLDFLPAGKFPAFQDRELCFSGGADDGVGTSGVPADPSPPLSVRPLRVTAWRGAGSCRERAEWTACQ